MNYDIFITPSTADNNTSALFTPFEEVADADIAAPKHNSDKPLADESQLSTIDTLLRGEDPLKAAARLVERQDRDDFTLGGVLSHIQRYNLHCTLGYSGTSDFQQYIEQELGVKYRKARYLISIYECFSKLGLDEARLSAMGWSKAKELVRVVNKDNFDALADFAQSHSRRELIEHLRANYMESNDDTRSASARPKKTKLVLSLHNDQATTVTRALEAAKQQAGTDDLNVALTFACAEYSLMCENLSLTLEETLELIRVRFGVRLTVIEDRQDDVEALADDLDGASEDEAN
ncbi:hypothetical protein [Xanthobacter sp. 91]|uniref:hypothetical protein n=1 Tax=Xanthobacter sp. 91 TaxID=1117244 RepID=UPI0012DD2A43|nr:hypothetical protein [Xanthobacter sp. 91]